MQPARPVPAAGKRSSRALFRAQIEAERSPRESVHAALAPAWSIGALLCAEISVNSSGLVSATTSSPWLLMIRWPIAGAHQNREAFSSHFILPVAISRQRRVPRPVLPLKP